MDPTEKGWILKFIEKRLNNIEPLPNNSLSFEEKLYKYLQPSGIIYGHPIKLPYDFIKTDDFPIKERLEVVFADSLFATSQIFHSINKASIEDMDDIIDELNAFFLALYPKINKTKLFESKPSNKYELFEKILQNRVEVKKEWNSNFWRGFFQNILLFVDIIIFIQYIESNKKITSEELQNLNKELQWNIIYLLSISVQLTDTNDGKESDYYKYFIDSTTFSKEEKAKATEIFKASNIEKIYSFLNTSNWITKKYFLELVLISIWADHKVNLAEKKFFEELSSKLNIEHIEVIASTLAIESFVLNNWTKIHYLQSKQNYLILSKRLTQRMSLISNKYINEIKKEIEEDKELLHLLSIAQKRPLSIEERNSVRTQLFDIIKTIPTFILLVLPAAFITIPILLKILPKNAMPSSFDPNKLSSNSNARGKSIIIEG